METLTKLFVSRVDAFLERTGVGPTTLGRQALGDPNLVRDLRLGRSPTLATADYVMAFMETHDRAPSGDLVFSPAGQVWDCTSTPRRMTMTRSMGQGMDAPTRVLRFPKCKPARGCRGTRSPHRWPAAASPEPVRLGSRAVGWIESEVDEWIRRRIEESRGEAK